MFSVNKIFLYVVAVGLVSGITAIGYSPLASSGVPKSMPIIITFDKTVAAGTGNIEFTSDAAETITIASTDVRVTFSSRTVTIDASNDFETGNVYQMAIAPGAITYSIVPAEEWNGLTSEDYNITIGPDAPGTVTIDTATISTRGLTVDLPSFPATMAYAMVVQSGAIPAANFVWDSCGSCYGAFSVARDYDSVDDCCDDCDAVKEVYDKVGFAHQTTLFKQCDAYCGSCYLAKAGCCNSCQAVKDAYSEIGWDFNELEFEQCRNDVDFTDYIQGGCNGKLVDITIGEDAKVLLKNCDLDTATDYDLYVVAVEEMTANEVKSKAPSDLGPVASFTTPIC